MTRRWIRWQRPLVVPPAPSTARGEYLISRDMLAGLPPPRDPVKARLRVQRDRVTGRWCWWVLPLPTNTWGHAATHAEALAVGMAVLEATSVGLRTRL